MLFTYKYIKIKLFYFKKIIFISQLKRFKNIKKIILSKNKILKKYSLHRIFKHTRKKIQSVATHWRRCNLISLIKVLSEELIL